jgi:hypothetical protein
MNAQSAEVAAFLEAIPSAVRRRDAERMLALMDRVTGLPPRIQGKSAGYGTYHYKYASGREGDAAAAAFAARREATVVYLMDGIGAHAEALERLGPHTTGVGCLYIKDLDEVDLDVLESIVGDAYATLTAGTYTLRAREGGQA